MYSIKYYSFDSEESTKLINMKIGEEITATQQLGLDETEDELKTSIKYLGLSENENYHKYLIEHEGVKEINGRYKNEFINYYISSNKLELYRSDDNTHIFIKGSNELAKSALSELSNSEIIKINNYSIDLLELIKNAKNIFIKGGWFGKLKISNVSSAGIFGVDVNDSDMWEELESKGDLSAIVFQITIGVAPVSVMINKSGNFLLYNKWDEQNAIEQAFEVVKNIKKYFI